MENALKNLTEPTDEDIESIELLYNSLIKHALVPNHDESSERHVLGDENEEICDPKLLSMIIQKCFSKIRANKAFKEECIKHFDDLQNELSILQEENMELKEAQHDLKNKLTQFQNYIDDIEAQNDELQFKNTQLERQNKEYLHAKETKKILAKSHSLSFNIKEESFNEISKSLQKEVEEFKVQISSLKETMNLQEQIIDKLQNEIDDYQIIEAKHHRLKSLLNNALQCKDIDVNIDDEIASQIAEFAEKFKLLKQNESLQINGNKEEISNSNGLTSRSSVIERSSVDNNDNEQDNKNYLAIRNSFSMIDESQSRALKRQKSLAEDIMESRKNGLIKDISPQNWKGIHKQKSARSGKLETRSIDFTRDLPGIGRYSKNTVGTFYTSDENERGGFTPEMQSPQRVLESDEESKSKGMSEVEALDEEGEGQEREINYFDEEIFQCDLSLFRRSKSFDSKEINQQESSMHLVSKKEKEVCIFSKREDGPITPGVTENSFNGRTSHIGKINFTIQETVEIISSVQEIEEIKEEKEEKEKEKQDKTERALAIKRYVEREIPNAVENTNFSLFKLISLLIFGS